jgi:hypothetical protein
MVHHGLPQHIAFKKPAINENPNSQIGVFYFMSWHNNITPVFVHGSSTLNTCYSVAALPLLLL